jgi:hypothetical protein
MSWALPLTLVLLTSAEAADAVVAYLTDLGALDPQDRHALFLGRSHAAQLVVGLLYQIGQPISGDECSSRWYAATGRWEATGSSSSGTDSQPRR